MAAITDQQRFIGTVTPSSTPGLLHDPWLTRAALAGLLSE
jgi:hypothetical protein